MGNISKLLNELVNLLKSKDNVKIRMQDLLLSHLDYRHSGDSQICSSREVAIRRYGRYLYKATSYDGREYNLERRNMKLLYKHYDRLAFALVGLKDDNV